MWPGHTWSAAEKKFKTPQAPLPFFPWRTFPFSNPGKPFSPLPSIAPVDENVCSFPQDEVELLEALFYGVRAFDLAWIWRPGFYICKFARKTKKLVEIQARSKGEVF